jgi:hypothetical protein
VNSVDSVNAVSVTQVSPISFSRIGVTGEWPDRLSFIADPRVLGSIQATSIVTPGGSALTHHPHVHGIVPGGGLSKDGTRWVACRPGFFLSVRVLSRLFRRRFLEKLELAHLGGQLQFFGEYA